MYHGLLGSREFFERLLGIDRLIAAEVQAGGCECGGRLDRAPYPRKPRGVVESLGAEFSSRESFSCCREGCRKRTTPPSVRFLGPRVYASVVVLIAAAGEGGVTKRRLELLGGLVGWPLSRRTVERWVSWWRETLPKTRVWQAIRGRLQRPVSVERMPLSLVEAFPRKSPEEAVVGVLRLLSPISVGHAS